MRIGDHINANMQISVFNLNCNRLKDNRLTVINNYNERIKAFRINNDKKGRLELAKSWLYNETTSFYTTRRILFGAMAEKIINQQLREQPAPKT